MDFFNTHGNYEVSFKASKTLLWEPDKEPIQKMIIEADSEKDAKRRVEAFLKKQRYFTYNVLSAKLLKQAEKSEDWKKKEEYQHARDIIIVPLVILIAFIVLIASWISKCFGSEVEGKYELIDVGGTYTVEVNYDNTYLEMKDGQCTLHLSLINPYGHSTHQFKYKGNEILDVEFDKDYINMNSSGEIIFILKYDNGAYIAFTFKKE